MNGTALARHTAPAAAALAMVLATLLSGGCSGGPVARSLELFPPAAGTPASLRRIAVMPAVRPGLMTPDVAAELEQALAAVRIEGQAYFEVVDRRRLGDVLRELRLTDRGPTDPAQAARAGQLLGAQALVHADLVQHELRSQPVVAQRPVCVQPEQRSDRQGRPLPERCRKTEWQPARCTLLTAHARLRVRMVESGSGRVAVAEDAAGHAEQTYCPGDTWLAAKPSGQDLLQRARAQAVHQARMALAPSYRQVDRPLLRAGPTGENPVAQRHHEQALAFAAAGRMEPACALWNRVLQEPGGRTPATLHNLAVCAELDGRLRDALAWHLQAEGLLTAPDRTIARAIDRVRAALEAHAAPADASARR